MTVIAFPEKPREYDCPDCGREVLEFPPFANPPGVCVYCEFLRETREGGTFMPRSTLTITQPALPRGTIGRAMFGAEWKEDDEV